MNYQVPKMEQDSLETSCSLLQGSIDVPDTVVDDFEWSEIPEA